MAAKPKSTEVVDPIFSTRTEIQRRINAMSGSILDEPPLRDWTVGLVSLKANVGAQLPWDEVAARLTMAAKTALKPRAKIVVGGKARYPTEQEKDTLLRYVAGPKVVSSIKSYVKRSHPELWISVVAVANGRGTGVRRDEEKRKK